MDKIIFNNWSLEAYNYLVADVTKGIVYCVSCHRMVEINIADHPNMQACSCTSEKKTYGKWTIIGGAEKRKTKRYVLAKCDCGREREVAYSNLVTGASTSCGECGTKSKRLSKAEIEKQELRDYRKKKQIQACEQFQKTVDQTTNPEHLAQFRLQGLIDENNKVIQIELEEDGEGSE